MFLVGHIIYYLSWPGLLIWSRFRKSARVMVNCNNKVLVVYNWYGSGLAAVLGGVIKHNVSPKMAALRELKVVTGILMAVVDFKDAGKFKLNRNGIV